jgi:hypothetical protein
LKRSGALQWARSLSAGGRAAWRCRLRRPGALQWASALQRPGTLQRTGTLLRALALLRIALAALLRPGRPLRLIGGLGLLSRSSGLSLRLLAAGCLGIRRRRHQQHRCRRNTLRPKCNFSHKDQPHRSSTLPLQAKLNVYTRSARSDQSRRVPPTLTAKIPNCMQQAKSRKTCRASVEVRPHSSRCPKTKLDQMITFLAADGGMKATAVSPDTHNKINCSVNAENEIICI